ncbi:MAG TPA: hypothetical protein VNP92_09090 [Actinophytocola sp.]|nr:hypothetical protein [Actinophytocola sp.]
MPDAPRPSVAEIRRALAECMTVEDIDDAMGWAPGTARRRRWRIPERGGLPFADAELAGVPLWFRLTIETWRADASSALCRDRAEPGHPDSGEQAAHATATVPPAEPPAGLDVGVPAAPPAEPPAELDIEVDAEVDTEDPVDSPPAPPQAAVHEAGSGSDAPTPQPLAEGDARSAAECGAQDEQTGTTEPDIGAAEPVDADQGPDAHEATRPAAIAEPGEVAVRSGFDLQVGQRVLAHVHGRWREARVGHRDRTTVAVDYDLDATPLGGRRQRVGIDRVRLPQS